MMAAWSETSRTSFHGLYFLICFPAHRLLRNTLQPSTSICSAVFYCCCVGVKFFFKSEKQRNEKERVREEVIQFTATSLRMCYNKRYRIQFFLLRVNLESSVLCLSSSGLLRSITNHQKRKEAK